MIEKLIRRGALLDLMLIYKGGLTGEQKVESTIDFSDNEMAQFRILRGKSQAKSKSQPWTSGEQIFFICRNLPENGEWPKKVC